MSQLAGFTPTRNFRTLNQGEESLEGTGVSDQLRLSRNSIQRQIRSLKQSITANRKKLRKIQDDQSQPLRKHGLQRPWSWKQVLMWVEFFLSASLLVGEFTVQNLHLGEIYGSLLVTTGATLTVLVGYFALRGQLIDSTDDSVKNKLMLQLTSAQISTDQSVHSSLTFYCHICKTYVGGQTKHCSTCNKCVAHFDHHCEWLNNCVGQANLREFYLLVALYTLQVIFQAAFQGLLLSSSLKQALPSGILTVLLCFYIAKFVMLAHLQAQVIYYWWLGVSTYEYIVE